jgi:hypothetical protein
MPSMSNWALAALMPAGLVSVTVAVPDAIETE